MADKCESWINGAWSEINISTALAYPYLSKRCIECHGSVRIHKAGIGVSAHAEHRIGFHGCSLAQGFKGIQRMHPIPAQANITNLKAITQIGEEVILQRKYAEGAIATFLVNAYERDPLARKACLKHFGYKCAACNKSLEDAYGPLAKKIIHVHHLHPLSKVKANYKVNPIKDLRPVCPNCHSIIHSKSEPFSIIEIKNLLQRNRRSNI